MGSYITIYVDEEELKKRLERNKEGVWFFLNFLKHFLEGKQLWVVESFFPDIRNRRVETFEDFKNLVRHYFNEVNYNEVIEFVENLESDVAKDLFSLLYQKFVDKALFFIIEKTFDESYFVPFVIKSSEFGLEEYEKNGKKMVWIDKLLE